MESPDICWFVYVWACAALCRRRVWSVGCLFLMRGVCLGMRDRMEGAEEWRNPLTSVGLRMSRHARPDGRHGETVESSGICWVVYVWACAASCRRHVRAAGRLFPGLGVCPGIRN